MAVVFFLSSRRRHTRFDCDWSSDVCSSDLCVIGGFLGGALVGLGAGAIVGGGCNGDELCGIQYVFTIPAGALVGIIVGSVIGGEHWDRVDVPATVTFRPEPSGRVAVGVSLRF